MNKLTAVRYDKRTTFFDKEEELKYYRHFLSSESKDQMVSNYIKSQITKNSQFRRELLNQPVCPHCEGFTFFHKGGAQCTKCGKWTPENQTMAVKRYMREGMYR